MKMQNAAARPAKGKRDLPPHRLVERKIRLFPSVDKRVVLFAAQNGKPLSNAWRDVVFAGLNALGAPQLDEKEQ